MKPVLQVALDLVHGDRALRIAADAVKGGADWIEAGTPLIKSEGMDIVRELKKAFPKQTIVADMKTIDVGGAEVEIAAKSGADVVVVLGVSSNPTITEAILSARLRAPGRSRRWGQTTSACTSASTSRWWGALRCPSSRDSRRPSESLSRRPEE
jgi:orotidine-5'-phosphate decarboxylase